jgi:hypothetical protein
MRLFGFLLSIVLQRQFVSLIGFGRDGVCVCFLFYVWATEGKLICKYVILGCETNVDGFPEGINRTINERHQICVENKLDFR